MSLKKFRYKKSVVALLIFIVAVFAINAIVSNVIKSKITHLLLKENSKYYTASIEDVNFYLLQQSVVINQVFFSPKKESINALKVKKLKGNALKKISVSSIELKGIHLFKLLFNSNIKIDYLQLNNVLIQEFKNSKVKLIKPKKKEKFNIDSIYLKKINGFELNKIKIVNLTYQVTDLSSDEIVFQTSPLNFNVTGFALEEIGNQYFKLKPVNNSFEIDNIKIDFPDKKYAFSMESMSVNFTHNLVTIKKINYKPTVDKFALANTYVYNTAVIGLEVEEINLYNFNFEKAIESKGIFADSVSLNSAKIDIYKDKRKPFDERVYKKLPHVVLKQLKLPVYIPKIKITDSDLILKERFEKTDVLLDLTLNNISATITNVTSIKKYRNKPLKIKFYSKLMNKSNLYANMTFPLQDNTSVFYFNGVLGASKFTYYDKAIFPVLGLKILNGDLDKLTFKATANNNSASGEMTMLYHDLEAKVFKPHSAKENKFLSWSVNSVLRESNPNKHGKVKTVVLNYDRLTYTGFGSYLWKILQSGITNTLAPTGKTVKKKEEKKRRKLKRQQRKINN